MTEREAIVAWLREQSQEKHRVASIFDDGELSTLWRRDASIALGYADAIEAGQHLENSNG